MWQSIRCFFGYHVIYSEPHFKREYMIDMGMRKIRYYDCPCCGLEFSKII